MKKYSLIIFTFIALSCTQDPIRFGEIKGFKITNFENNKMQCKVDIEILNSGYFDVSIKTGELHAFSDNFDLGTVTMIDPLEIKGNSEQVYTLLFTISITNPEAGMASIIGRLAGKKPVYSIQGTVFAQSFLGDKKITVNEVLGK